MPREKGAPIDEAHKTFIFLRRQRHGVAVFETGFA